MVYVSPGETDAQKFPLRRDRSIQIKTVQLSNKRQSGLGRSVLRWPQFEKELLPNLKLILLVKQLVATTKYSLGLTTIIK